MTWAAATATSRMRRRRHEDSKLFDLAIPAGQSRLCLRLSGCHCHAVDRGYSVAVVFVTVLSVRPIWEPCRVAHVVVQSSGLSVSLAAGSDGCLAPFGLGLDCLWLVLHLLLVAYSFPNEWATLVKPEARVRNSGHSHLRRHGGANAAGTWRRVDGCWVCFPDWPPEPRGALAKARHRLGCMTEGRWPSRQGRQSVMQAYYFLANVPGFAWMG